MRHIAIRLLIWICIGAAVGGLCGLAIGVFAPVMYSNWFEPEYVERVGAVWIGVSLGVSEGAGLGLIIGLGTVIFPWLNRKTSAQLNVHATFDSTTGVVSIENKGRVPVLVFGVWALREIDTCSLFEEPVLISEGTKKIPGQVWSNNDGDTVEKPKTGALAVIAIGPTINN